MLIIVEGVDGSGKTTLINTLAEKFKALKIDYDVSNAEIMIDTRPTSTNRVSSPILYFNMLYMIASDIVYICDRSPISDIIYRAFDEYETVTDLHTLLEFWQTCKSNMIIIHCDTKNSLELLTKRGDNNKIAFEKHKEIKYLYNQIMPLFEAIKYDFTVDHGFINSFVMKIAESILR